ncbi:MAG: hypothetical protein ACD_11C00103G0024 [uncultured bacterium]|nr:MAG: hypothetical protein ACD_11C00103G0024 [uncultured bacterium]HBR71479.1 hypothetical protein [Candidatus Moranbacteria bacterium]
MARVGLPRSLARCGCGGLKVQDVSWEPPYWTRYVPYVEGARAVDLPKEKCPMCGGDNKILIGSFFAFSVLAAGLPQGA